MQGRALQAALAVGLVCLAAAFWAGSVDLTKEVASDPGPLNALSIVFKLIGVVALSYVGWRTLSRSMWLLALLLAMLTLGHLVIDSGLYDRIAHPITRRLGRLIHLHGGFLNFASMFIVLAIVAGGLVWAAYRSASPSERRVVLQLIAIIFVVGVFVGPVNAISAFGINREWLFAEDFGQVVALAVLTAYAAGLVVASWGGSGRLRAFENAERN